MAAALLASVRLGSPALIALDRGMLAAAAAPLTADVEALTAAIWATSHGFAQLAQAGTFKSAGLAADPEIALRATLRALVKRDPFALPVQ